MYQAEPGGARNDVRVKLDSVYTNKPKEANTIQCLSLGLTLVFAGPVMLDPNAHHACRL